MRIFTEAPPDREVWADTIHDFDAHGKEQPKIGSWMLETKGPPSQKLSPGARVKALFEHPSGPQYYLGVVQHQNEDGSWVVLFEDGEAHNFFEDDPDLDVVLADSDLPKGPPVPSPVQPEPNKVTGRKRRRPMSPEPNLKQSAVVIASPSGPGPWETWLETYLPDLLLSSYRAYRRDPSKAAKPPLDPILTPENFLGGDIVVPQLNTRHR